ncbi:MAG: PCMD domain-containing protein [Candidatus Egerieousia sp.]|nr:PCMD domain-containing protein [bacterium]MDY2650614.1 PCMD domain-containing protein [Candidatus Egerieousia sp.]MDY3134658.1 PCMD domain-containing protein [Candidatus Egerieousia sp.]MDY3294084.1 PCMD domain-containing protein [Candidatus Egerieousia sp.]MDY5319275.1 PCMD domain-containing protein [Candidatus Egerieousia sp.]
MKRLHIFLLAIAAMAFLAAGCVKNDLPYPTVVAEITAFEVSGQTSCNIDRTNRTVAVVVDDTQDIEELKVVKVVVSNDATVEPAFGSTINLASPVKVVLSTYQDYEWTISAKQVIERYINAQNQIGAAEFDEQQKIAKIYVVKNQDLSNITIKSIKLGQKGSVISPDPATVHDFSSPVKFDVVFNGKTTVWTVAVEHSDVEIITGAVNPWAKFLMVEGEFQEGSGTPTFEYRKSSDVAWTKLPASEVKVEGGKFSAVITNLLPDTKYVVRSVINDLVGQEKEFTTEALSVIPNLNFDTWKKGSEYGDATMTDSQKRSWYANADLTTDNYWWDSANQGANTMSEMNPIRPETGTVLRGSAARIGSTLIWGIYVPGSMWVGKYIKTTAAGGCELSMGKPFTSRPASIKGYMRYLPGIVDKAEDPYTDRLGKPDTCYIYAVLADWDEPFIANTSDKIYIDLQNNPGIIALAYMEEARTLNEYTEFEMKFEYRSTTRKPKYITFFASPSKLCNYNTGCATSELYLDELEMTYADKN